MKNPLIKVLGILFWTAPACYLVYKMAGGGAGGGVGRDFDSLFAYLDETERFFMNWLAVNCVIALIGMTILFVSPRMRYLVWGEEKQLARESIIVVYGCLTVGLMASLAFPALFD